MKKLLSILLVAITMIIAGCSESFDDSKIWDKLEDHESRIAKLEELCKQMNTNISSLQTIVKALQNNDYITGVTPITENGATIGYTITFAKAQSITIYNGKDGTDGSTPVIGVKQDTDNIYYWTLNGEWLLDANGNKIKAQGTDGKDGANGEDGVNGVDGKDGITPQLKIENDYWYISYDNGASWTQLGKATGEDGKDGQDGVNGADGKDGDSFFQDVVVEEQGVRFVLADGSEIVIPLAAESAIGRLQSITYIPKYTDGKATIKVLSESSRVVEMDFEISPISVATEIAENWATLVNMKALYTATRAVEWIEMPILSCEVDSEAGVLSVTASAVNLSEEFIAGTQSASARLAITDGDINVTSDYVQMVAQIITQPDNEIWYTSTDGNAVTPKIAMQTRATDVENVFDEALQMWILRYDSAVVEIPNDAFSGCKTLKTILLPKSVTKIGDNAFKNCSGLTGTFVIPEAVIEIGATAFYKCSAITSFDSTFASEDGRSLVVNDALVAVATGNLTEHIIPAGATAIASSAYEGCTTLTAITIPEGVESIGDYAFYGCSNLATVNLPTTLTFIDTNAFNGCSSLVSLEIPDSVTEIGVSAFAGCKGLTTVSISNNLTTIGKQAFYNCSKLNSVTFGSNVTTIGQQAFFLCSGLTEIVIPDTVTEIGTQAFYNCKLLASVTFGKNLTTLGDQVFEKCSALENVLLPEGLTSMGNRVFYTCESLASVSIPKGISLIPEMTFSGCSSLKSITIASESIELGNSAFEGSGLTELNFLDKVSVIGTRVFANCKSLESVVIGSNVESIGESAFSNSALQRVTINNGVTSIGNTAFNSTKLTEVEIPSSVVSIGKGAFQSTQLSKVTLNEGLQSIGASAFISLYLVEVTIPSTVTSIGSSAFAWNTKLATIYCKPVTPPTLESAGFSGSVTGRKLYVPVGSGEAYKAATTWTYYASYIEEMEF